MNPVILAKRKAPALFSMALAALLLAGCVVQDQRPMPRIMAEKNSGTNTAD